MTKAFSEIDRYKLECASHYLAHIDSLDKTQADAETQIAVIEAMAMPGAMRYDAVNVQTSPSDDAIPNAVSALEDVSDLEYLIEQVKEERAKFCLMLRYEIKSVGGTFLYTHYKYGIDYKTIARTAGIDESTERRKRKEALVEMYDKGLVPQEYRIPIERAI